MTNDASGTSAEVLGQSKLLRTTFELSPDALQQMQHPHCKDTILSCAQLALLVDMVTVVESISEPAPFHAHLATITCILSPGRQKRDGLSTAQ